MNEVTHQWDRFYGLKYFYPGLYTPEEAWEVKSAISPNLWPLLLDVCMTGGLSNYYIGAAQNGGRRAMLVNQHGFPLVELACDLTGTEYGMNNWYRYLKKRGNSRYSIVSKKRSYVVKTGKPHLEAILLEVEARQNSHLVNAAQSVNSFLNNETNNATYIQNQTLIPEHMYDALRLVFDDKYNMIQVSPPVLTKLQSVYEDLCKRFAEKKSYAERIKDMFDHPKWVIGYMQQYDKRFLMIGSARLTPQTISGAGSYKLEYETPLKLYRDFNAFYAKHPDDEGSLKTALMFCKVYREKTPLQAQTHDTEGFIPCNSDVYEDIGGISYNGGVGLNVTSPQYLLLQK